MAAACSTVCRRAAGSQEEEPIVCLGRCLQQRDGVPKASCCVYRSRDGAFRLELQAQTQLWGVVESLVTLPAQSRDVRDVILLTFRCGSSLPAV